MSSGVFRVSYLVMLTAPEMGSMIFLQLAAYVSSLGRIHSGGLYLIDELALVTGDHNHAGKMRIAFDGFVFVIDQTRREKERR